MNSSTNFSETLRTKSKQCRQRRLQKFFQGGGGKRRIHYLLDEINPYSSNQDFVEGFEPNVSIDPV